MSSEVFLCLKKANNNNNNHVLFIIENDLRHSN